MAFRVEIQPQALDDLDSIADNIKARSSFATAEKWFNGILDDIASLKEMPERCSIAPESEGLDREVASSSMADEIEATGSISRSTMRQRSPALFLFFTFDIGPEDLSMQTNWTI